MIDFNSLIFDGWSFGALDIDDYHALRPTLKEIEEMPNCYAIALDEIGTPSFTRQKHSGPSCYFATRGMHPQHGEVYIFANSNDESYVLAKVPIEAMLE
ncbi:hypothetical protein [Phyllobacterium phragmitis]|uniref:Uncharacterized protein n=1 Tax=Phyllobacterium phragmitis TaxID=2670329 RepID=A0ABQ0H5D8_9HYPH